MVYCVMQRMYVFRGVEREGEEGASGTSASL